MSLTSSIRPTHATRLVAACARVCEKTRACMAASLPNISKPSTGIRFSGTRKLNQRNGFNSFNVFSEQGYGVRTT